jgi:hypothetical protein
MVNYFNKIKNNQSYKPSWKSGLKSKSLVLLTLSNLPVTVTPFPQNNNLIVYEYKGLDKNGLPILYQTDLLKEPLLNGPGIKILENFEKDVLSRKKADYNITGDIDDYIKDLTDNKKIITKENSDLVATLKVDQLKIVTLETKVKNQERKIQKKNLKISELSKRANITQEEFAKYKSTEQIVEIEKLAQANEAKKYQGFINPNDTAAILTQAESQGVKFTQLDLDQTINQTDYKYRDYKSPQEVKVIEEKVKKLRDANRKNIRNLQTKIKQKDLEIGELNYQIKQLNQRPDLLNDD